MPGTIRITVDGLGARPQRGGFCSVGGAILATLLPLGTISAQEGGTAFQGSPLTVYASAFLLLDRHEIAALALTLGILCFAVVTAILLVRTRRRLAAAAAAAHDEAIAARSAIDRAYTLLLSEPQILIAWPATAEEPEILGDPTLVGAHAPEDVLAFGGWLTADTARAMQSAVDALRARGASFAMTVVTLTNQILEAEGQAVGGRAILRLREVSGVKYELAELTERYRKQVDDAAAMRALIEAITAPVWYRDAAGKLVFVNQAYARAVDARDAAEVVERGIELFDHGARN